MRKILVKIYPSANQRRFLWRQILILKNNFMNEENNKSQRAQAEEKVLEFWKENKIFEKSLEKESPKGEYVFYEGPPTANGKPGIHHLEARAFKDAIPRYKTMCGYHVRRKGGWDTHGLPVELQVEKKLGLDSKKAIEEYGISKFNKECKESVWEYTDLWTKFTERIGYWVDKDNPYVTYHNKYIESVWNVIKEADKQKLLFKDYKVVPWCPRCGTGLSSHELAQGYQDVKDLSVYVKFKVIGQDNTYILAWTTTPWTLPGNVALAVGEDIDYLKIKVNTGEIFVLAKERLSVIDGEYEILGEMKGKDLIGLEYKPLYPYLKEIISNEEKSKLDKAYKVHGADFVTTEDGTGVVHTAVMYGQDDFELGTKIGLPKVHLVGLDGKFFEGTDFLSGRFVRDEETAVEVIKDLAHRGFLLKKEKYEHSYPHCWRCKTALVYYARDSWYIRMSELRNKMVKENEGINWEPSYIKEGRFGEWLSDIKDWAISRERYWGTPLPVWTCNDCGKREVVGGLDDIKSKTKKSGNNYIMMRHGEAESNLTDIISSAVNNEHHLTEKGKDQVKESALILKDKKIDLIFSSPLLRTKETAEIVASNIGYKKEDIIIDDRLHEMSLPSYEGKSWHEYHKDFPNNEENFYKGKEGCETWKDVKNRTMNFLYDLENKYEGKNILIVTHGGPCWLASAGIKGLNAKETLGMIKDFTYLKNAEFEELDFTTIPHDDNYELDFHKPYIDEVLLVCECGGKLERTKEVMDVWLDSGTMPFSQDHYPFENKDLIDSGAGYPADFISEAIDQTRGWFYTLHAVGAIMGKGKAYKNVICLGHILDANGKKMSKSLGNIVDPWTMINKYGVDTLRMWMYSVNQPGESKNFDEKTVSEINGKIFTLLYNVLTFYELYRDVKLEQNFSNFNTKNVLDKWIIKKFEILQNDVTKNLEGYKLLEPVRSIRDFIGDLSTWYVRRSRERLKDGDIEAKQTLYFVLKNLAKLMAPFSPFTAEDIWQKLKTENDEDSVHLSDWGFDFISSNNESDNVIGKMEETRTIVTMGLQARQKAGIPVRQPLNSISIIKFLSVDAEYQEIIKDEINIKNISFIEGEEEDIVLDTNITDELREEGYYREFVRALQDFRKKNGLNPNDLIDLEIKAGVKEQEFLNKFKNSLIKQVGIKNLLFKEIEGEIFQIGEFVFSLSISKYE